MTPKERKVMELALEAAYLEGFNASGEGYNGEYPFQDNDVSPEKDNGWIRGRDNRISAIKESLAQRKEPEQEPVAWIHNFIDGGISIGKRPADLNRHPDRWTALYKEPKPCPTCEALARTVMLDQTSHDTTPPQRKPLTDEQIEELMPNADGTAEANKVWVKDGNFPYCEYDQVDAWSKPLVIQIARAIEAAHGIGEKK
jgi:hypothetical protein